MKGDSILKMENFSDGDTYKNIPFNKLFESDENVRKKYPPHDYIVGLSNNIEINGLLQNLIVTPVNNGKNKGKYAVNAGRSRWLALGLLVQRKAISEDFPVLCKIEKQEKALITSFTENEMRLPMNPADRFEAYKKLIDSGENINSVAHIFNVKPETVERYLKLADISPKLFELFRDGQITIEQMQALTLAGNHAMQESVWFSSSEFERSPSALRKRLTQEDIDSTSNQIAIFVGLQAYEASGGEVRRDLFATSDSGYITDKELLYSLANKKLEAIEKEVNDEGWSWVDLTLEQSYTELFKFYRLKKVDRSPTSNESLQLDKLEGAREALIKRMNQVVDEDSELYDDLSCELDDIDEEIYKIEGDMMEYDAEEMKRAGAIITIDSEGKPIIHRGLVRPQDRVKSASVDENPKEKQIHSERLIRRLSAHRTVAVQVELTSKPDIALAVAVYKAVKSIFYEPSNWSTNAENLESQLIKEADDLEVSPAWKELKSQREIWKDKLPDDENLLFDWIYAQPQEAQIKLLAVCTSFNIDGVQAKEGVSSIDFITEAVELDMAKWWTPTERSYFSHVSKARIKEIFNEVLPEKKIPGIDQMKKSDLTAVAEKSLSETGWLPAIFCSRKTFI